MSMRHLIVMDPLSQLNLQLDSSLKLARALEALGHKVRFCDSADLSALFQDRVAVAKTYSLPLEHLAPDSQAIDIKEERLIDFHSVQMRKEPPFNLDYVASCWLLDMKGSRPIVYNDPAALLRFNEKLSIFHFPDFSDRALVTRDPQKILDFARSCDDDDIVLKPLDLYGGRGVERLVLTEKSDQEAFEAIQQHTGGALRLVQPFNRAIFDGEIRAFGFKEHVLSWCLKIPKSGSYFANTREGATLQKFTPHPRLQKAVEHMGKTLAQHGISIWGVDIIGDFLSEVNVTSPRMLLVDEDEDAKYQEFAKLLVEDISERLKSAQS